MNFNAVLEASIGIWWSQSFISIVSSWILFLKKKSLDSNKLFGSVNAASIQSELSKNDIDVDKKYIIINGSNIIKNTGSFSANIRLHRGLEATLSFEVLPA